MDVHVHVTKGACNHILIRVHNNLDDSEIGSFHLIREDLEVEATNYDSAKERLLAQLIARVLANRGSTIAQLKTALETGVYKV